jgi:hypothetical protein
MPEQDANLIRSGLDRIFRYRSRKAGVGEVDIHILEGGLKFRTLE